MTATFRIGDRVRVARKCAFSRASNGAWVKPMDACVGRVGEVVTLAAEGVGVAIDGDWWYYPPAALEAIAPAEEADRLAEAAADLVEALAPFYVGNLPDAVRAVATALRRADADPSAAIEDARDALRSLSRAKP